MDVNKTQDISSKSGISDLSVQQLNSIDLLVTGKSGVETAREVGVTQETVSRWRSNPYYIAELNRRRNESWSGIQDRLIGLAGKALDCWEAALDGGDRIAAVEVFKALGLYGVVQPPAETEQVEVLVMEDAKERAKVDFRTQYPNIGDPIVQTLEDIEIPGMAKEYYEEMMEELNGNTSRDRQG